MLQKPKHEKIEICNLSGRFGDPCGRQGDSVVSGRLPDNQGELAYMWLAAIHENKNGNGSEWSPIRSSDFVNHSYD